MKYTEEAHPDVVLIGAGIMSATLGVLLRTLEPDWNIHVFERLEEPAGESSDAWNNAGTGHSAFCELNYTPRGENGKIDISKAVKIAEQFETSKEFWSSLVERGVVSGPDRFIRSCPHMSFVRGHDNVEYLHQRCQALIQHHLFRGMVCSDDPKQLQTWMPLVMDGREKLEELAATRMEIGTDVDFGTLTRSLFAWLGAQKGVQLYFSHQIRDIDREDNGHWHINVKDLKSGQRRWLNTPFVFIGAGGGALRLLEKSDIPEGAGFGGFPVSGQWLVCQNEEIAGRHAAKVYGKAAVGTPPMSVPHLDTRVIDGKKALLFGPYAGFSTRFLKNGSLFDLPESISPSNILPMLAAGWHNIPLTQYLVGQVIQSEEERLDALREFMPKARAEDWRLRVAGQRVQVIKKDPKLGGVLEFGTEIVSSGDGSIAALLGASPGASTSVSIMLEILARCFPDRVHSQAWQKTLEQLIPSYGKSLAHEEELAVRVRQRSSQLLQLA